ncbi:MAG TPA: alkaline phosphatase family protein [Terriglobales bacterium]|nr:alkaline phosphatase family protein [Terriglobales bacterium]
MRYRIAALLLTVLLNCTVLSASAYNAQPKLVVVIVIDQFRGDYLERAHDQLVPDGFRLLIDRGAYFDSCNYGYANTRTAPGHATLFTGAYSDGHGILANEWWDPVKKKMVTSVEDDTTRIVGVSGGEPGASPHKLLADTIGDELRLATQGRARVFSISLKDRSAVLPGGFSANAAYWIDHSSGAWITSTYYMNSLPAWVQQFNSSGNSDKYWNREWKNNAGQVLRNTNKPAQKADFYGIIGSTPFANDYEFDFARTLITNEKLGQGPATDLLLISLSANDILGHQVGPDSPQIEAMALALDRQLAGFFGFLGKQIGLGNVLIALSADHGISPMPPVASSFRLPAANLDERQLSARLNDILAAKYGPGTYVPRGGLSWPVLFLDENAFAGKNVREADAEHTAGEALKQVGMRSYFTRSELADFRVPADELGRRYLHSFSPEPSWYVLGVPAPYFVGTSRGTDHASPYNYDTHVPLAFFGLPFQPGVYREHSEPVDLAVTLASLLGINAPNSAVGRVLTEALRIPPNAAARRGIMIPAETSKEDKH